MERQQCNSLQNFDESKSEILKKRLLKSSSAPASNNLAAASSQNNVLLNTLRAPISSSMIVSSVSGGAGGLPLPHGLVTHALAPVKLHANTAPYPLQLSTVTVPVQLPGTGSNINVPVQLSGPTSSMPLQIAPVSLPIQVSGTTNVPVQLPAGETINVPLQIPGTNQNIQLGGPGLSSMPMLHSSSQPMNSIIHLHMGSNPRSNNIDGTEITVTSSAPQINKGTSQVQIGNNSTVVQIPNSSSNSIQLTLPNSVTSGTVQLRGTSRSMPHVVYIQTPQGLKPVTSTEVISQASTSGNPPQIIVRRPVTSNNIHLISNVNNKPHIAPKLPGHSKSSILAPAGTSPIVIQKPKTNEKVIVPVSIAPGSSGKQAIAYLSSVKKPNTKNFADNQSILISNNQPSVNSNNQKLFLTPMNMPKIQNTKFILPVTLPATMASKGPIINLQIANGQIQNDPQGNITVMRDSAQLESADMPPLQPLGKMVNINGKDSNSVPQSPNKSESFTMSIHGSRAEPTGEQGEYTLSIPETNAAMNDDIYTVSIADDEGGQSPEKSFTLAIPEKGKSLLNRNMVDRNDSGSHHVTVAAPAILRRSNSDNSERKNSNANLKRRISLCNENLSNKIPKPNQPLIQRPVDKSDPQDSDNNDDHRVPSLFCDEKLDKDLDCKVILGDSDEEYKDSIPDKSESNQNLYYKKNDFGKQDLDRVKRESVEGAPDDDPPGLVWSNGVGQLAGSVLQFQTNEFGLIEMIDVSDSEEAPLAPSAKYRTPLQQRVERARDKKPTSPEDLYRCDGCGCHGMAAEFITPNFCSITCQSEVQKSLQKKRDRERAELTRRRNKMKKLLMRKHHPDDAREPDDASNQRPDAESDPTLKVPEDLVENEKYPWMCGKNGFSWMRYLDHCKAKAAPVKLFKDPFPYNRNGFKVGMRMEAIDPQHASVWAVVSVAEVQGYRMRLHFDEYPAVHDYWVNADCADIFPAGWCERNGRTLRPPRSHASGFSWPLYLKEMRAIAAPRHLFPHITTTTVKPNAFRIGMKLEAEDRSNDMVCAATVADMLDARLLITFDSWDAVYDVWLDPSSPYIHPVGWAEENGIALTPPNFYKDPESFSWEAYLSETGASAAPPRAFKTRAPQGFKPGMKLEVVDKRVPFLIRVASISAVKGHQVRVSFDGWPEELAYWLDDDSPDLHPVGWCLKTGHPLEPPLTAEEVAIPGPCGVGGCRGLGSLRGGPHKQHVAASACPYRSPASPAPPDRLQPPARYLHRPLPTHCLHKQHVAASACPYRSPASPAPPDRLQPPARYLHRPLPTHCLHKQHVAASACPYRSPASPAPPDRLQPPARYLHRPLPTHCLHKQHVAASACPYRSPASPAPPDRLQPPARYLHRPLPTHCLHKQHVAASACPYRSPASPAPPDRLQPPARYLHRPLPTHCLHKQHVAASACPYRSPASPAPPDRLQPPARYLHRPLPTHCLHKQHVAASACPYRSPASPAPPDRLQPPARYLHRPLPTHCLHKQHVAASACPYRSPASPAPPDRLQPPARYLHRPLPTHCLHKQHVAASACPYRSPASPAPPDRLQPPARYLHRPLPTHCLHKQHVAASACPYRSPASPAPPDRLQPPARYLHRPLPTHCLHKQHVAASACPYRSPASPAPPDRLQPPARYLHRPLPTHCLHKQHVAASACPYRSPASPAPPDRLQPPARYLHRPLPTHCLHKQHVAASACPYRSPASPAPPDRLQPPARYLHRPLPTHCLHKQHVAASACPYRSPASPAPPDRLQPPARYLHRPLPTHCLHKQHVAASACPYRSPASPAPPDRLQPPARYLHRPLPTHCLHKQHVAASACPYRSPASPAPPDRLQPPARYLHRPLPTHCLHKQHVAASACPYRSPASPAPPDRLQPPARYLHRPLPTHCLHKQHVAASACPYRSPASPAPPDRLQPPARYLHRPLPTHCLHKQHVAASACPYRSPASPAPPDRLQPPARYLHRPLPTHCLHKQHVAASACPYRSPASPAPPDRLQPPARYLHRPLPTHCLHKQHVAASACPYRSPASPAPPDRLQPPARYLHRPLPTHCLHKQHVAASACPYRSPASPAPPDRLQPPARYLHRPLPTHCLHKQHVAASACPYRSPASPAPPDRLQPPARYLHRPLPTHCLHKQHVAASACPYRSPASPAPPDRLQPPARYLHRPLPTHCLHKQHVAASACPYRSPASPAPPDRLQPPARYLHRPLPTHCLHKQHVAASACPYRSPASPAPPDRLQPPARYLHRPLPTHCLHKQHVAASACPYRSPASPAPPDRLQPPARTLDQPPKPEETVTPTSDAPKETKTRGRPPKHKRIEEVTKIDPVSDEESVSSGGRARWRRRGARGARDERRSRGLRPDVAKHVAALRLPAAPTLWTQEEVCALLSAVAGAGAGAAARRARLAGRELLMASCEELVACLRLRLGPAIKVYGAVRQLRRTVT